MKCDMCDRCEPNPNDPGRCIYGGPFQTVPFQPIDERAYIGTAYGKALPPAFIGGQWRSQYQPWGPMHANWAERLADLRDQR